jgi:hypothetical protein
MPRVHFVKKARKDVEGTEIKAGESYYWWAFRYGGKRTSKTPPRQSQLTQSEFWGAVYGLQEREQPDFESLNDTVDEIKSELEQLRDEQEEKKSNMPEGLQEGATGELLQNRYDSIESAIGDLENVDIPDEDTLVNEVRDAYVPLENDDKSWDDLTKERRKELIDKAKREKCDELWNEISDALGNISD